MPDLLIGFIAGCAVGIIIGIFMGFGLARRRHHYLRERYRWIVKAAIAIGFIIALIIVALFFFLRNRFF